MFNLKLPLHMFAINVAKASAFMSQLLNLGAGTSLPGKLAQKISPGLLAYLVNQAKREKIYITGTNGKTTTAGLIAGILKADARKIVHNRKGANMTTGLITALCQASSVFGCLDVDNCLLEIDEAYFPLITKMAAPNVVSLTNLFRDQLDRYGELDTTAKKVFNGLDQIPDKANIKLVVNADDPNINSVAEKLDCKKIYYGIDNIVFHTGKVNVESQKEIANCKCGKSFEYNKVFYSHLGHYECSCGNKRPFADVLATNVQINTDFSDISLVTPLGSFSLRLQMPGLYNVYNALSAISVAISLNIEPEEIISGIEKYSTVFGRAETIKIKNKNVLIQLIKNPVGATEVLKTVANDPNARLIIGINDNYADGRDVSWLWDADFNLLNSHQKKVMCTGIRASDMALRLKYAGINPDLILVKEDIQSSIEAMVEEVKDEEKLYLLPTYTVLLEMQKFLPKLVDKK